MGKSLVSCFLRHSVYITNHIKENLFLQKSWILHTQWSTETASMVHPSAEKKLPSVCPCTCPALSAPNILHSHSSTPSHTVTAFYQTLEPAMDLDPIASPSADNSERTATECRYWKSTSFMLSTKYPVNMCKKQNKHHTIQQEFW